ncbi:MAG: sensor histidine kinase [Christensenellales bacterium]
MLKALKRKFILINMLLVFLVMTAVLLAGLIANYAQFTGAYRLALDRELALDMNQPRRDAFRTDLPREGGNDQPAKLTFTAVLKQDGAWTLLTPWMQVEQDTLAALCLRAQEAAGASGFWPDSGIAYARQGSRIAFINLQNEYAQLKGGLLAWGLIYLAALSAFLLISFLLSRWALRPVETAWMQQRRFVSDASHELKTPLTVILANLDILEQEQGESAWLAAARVESLRMKKLIEDLLFLARSDEARPPRQQEKVDLSALVSETALAFEALAYENGLRLHAEVAPGLHTRGDAEQLRQLAAILLDNAVKYTPAGGQIDVCLLGQRDRISLSVHNSKAYIAPDQLGRLFDRFYRRDEARSKSQGGYGLGLSIAAEIARQHGASLRASSSQAQGTCFTLHMQAMAD